MAPQTGTAILVLVVFVLPGFVALRYAEQTYRTRAEDSTLERILTALYFSLLSYIVIVGAAAAVLGADRDDVRELWRGERPIGTYVALAAAGIAVPLAIAELARQWNRSQLRLRVLRWAGISAVHKTPSGWEHFFQSDRWAYVRATLKDGRVIGGFFGKDSFAGYTSDTPDLYLEQRFQLDDRDWFSDPAPGTMGVYIRADEIVSVEFYEAGGVPIRASWWRRAWATLKGDASPSLAAADPQAGRDLAVADTEGADPTASSADGRGEGGTAEGHDEGGPAAGRE